MFKMGIEGKARSPVSRQVKQEPKTFYYISGKRTKGLGEAEGLEKKKNHRT